MASAESSGGGKTRRTRMSFTPYQLNTMEMVFIQDQYPDVNVFTSLAQRLAIPIEKICTWFQNRRSKYRKGSKTNHINWMRQQMYGPGKRQEGNLKTVDSVKPHPHVLSTGNQQASTSAQSFQNWPATYAQSNAVGAPPPLHHCPADGYGQVCQSTAANYGMNQPVESYSTNGPKLESYYTKEYLENLQKQQMQAMNSAAPSAYVTVPMEGASVGNSDMPLNDISNYYKN